MSIFLPRQYHFVLYYIGLCCVAAGLPLSQYLMGFSQFWLVINWLWEADYQRKWRQFITNKAALIVCSIILLHLLGLFYTKDLHFAIIDIKKKLPLFILPFIIATSAPLPKKYLDGLLGLFVLSVFVGTMTGLGVMLGWLNFRFDDMRFLSVFVAHIRFSLMLCIAIFILLYFLHQAKQNYFSVLFIVLIVWFVFFLFVLKSLSGVLALLATGFILTLYYFLNRKNTAIKILGLAIILLLTGGMLFYLKKQVNDFYYKKPVDIASLEMKTEKGNFYEHDLNSKETENGNYTHHYVCWKELEASWKQRSKIDFNGKGLKGNELKFTLIRFLTSKGLRKDAAGLAALSDEEIALIEKGVANVSYNKPFSLEPRIKIVIWELDHYLKGGDPSGHSILQRLEYWKIASSIIKQKFWFGVGTGDTALEFEEAYEKSDTKLAEKYWYRSHNQYLSFMVAFGIIGLLWFLIILFYPMLRLGMWNDFLYSTFFITATTSMMTDDTLETQAGVMFFAFFNALFLFGRERQR